MNPPMQLQYNDPGNSVYLLYQKEVYNCDHSFLQSLMDWLYSSNESPFKFIVRNKAVIRISRYGIIIQKESNAFNMSDEQSNCWTHIHFNLKHLKEIYVDKRHKDTCVLVSKVSPSSCSNYVWKKTNPSNYQSFRSPYGLNSAFKKSYLLTIIKFKDGPSKLLQTIQLLDSILADYNKQEDPKFMLNVAPNNTSSIQMKVPAEQKNKFSEDLAKYCNSIAMKNFRNFKVRPNVQQYFNDVFIKSQQQKFMNSNGICNHCGSNENSNPNGASTNQMTINQIQHQIPLQTATFQDQVFNGGSGNDGGGGGGGGGGGHASLRNRLFQQTRKRTLSIDNRHNSPLYANYNNNSNKSLQNYQLTSAPTSAPSTNYFSMNANQRAVLFGSSNSINFSNLSRQGSVNEICPSPSSNNQVLIVNRNLVPGTGYLPNTGNYNSISASAASTIPNHFSFNSYLDLNTTVNGPTTTACNSPQINVQNSPLSPHFGCLNPPLGLANSGVNTSNENLSEIGYQQYRKKYMNNLSVSSTSSLRNTLDIFGMKPASMMISHAKMHHAHPTIASSHHHHHHHVFLQKQGMGNAAICRQTELNGSITSMTSGYSNKIATSVMPMKALKTKSDENRARRAESVLNKSANTSPTINNDELKEVKEKQTSASSLSSLSSTKKETRPKMNENTNFNEISSVLLEEKNITLEKGEDENSKSKKASDYDDNEESTVTIVEEINYKEVKKAAFSHSSPTENAGDKRETSADSSLRKIPAKVLLDMLRSGDENDTAKMSSTSSKNRVDLVFIPSSANKKLDVEFLKKQNETSFVMKEELNSLTKLKESNKVRDIINSFNNFEKNNTNVNDYNSKKFFSKFNTINISNLGKPPPPVKKFNNPNNKLFANPVTAAVAALEQEKKWCSEVNSTKSIDGSGSQNMASLSFQLNASTESRTEKKLLKSITNGEVKSGGVGKNGGVATTNNNGNLVIINNITTKNLMNNETFLNKISDSIIKTDSTTINNDINIINSKLAKIVNMLNNESTGTATTVQSLPPKLKKPDNLKVVAETTDLSNEVSAITQQSSSPPPPPPQPSTTRKRTFANMVWPMDPEEEKILRSCSPYEVPEVIVQRNDSVKSILKKNNILQQQQSYNSSPTYLSPNPDVAGNSKKRVDFQENCCFINFFEIHDDELVATTT